MTVYNRFLDDPNSCQCCGKPVEDAYKMNPYAVECQDNKQECFDNRIKTRIFLKKHLKLNPKYVPDIEEQINMVWQNCRSTRIIALADFVVLIDEQGGVEFIKDRYENTKGMKFFAP